MEYGFNPPSLSFNYLPFSGNIPNEQVIFALEFEMRNMQVLQKPDWIDIALDAVVFNEDEDKWTLPFVVSINPSYANTMQIGYHSGIVQLKGQAFTPITGWGNFTSVNLPITLRVLEYTPLTISPSLFYFSHIQGDPNPPARYFQLNTSGSWSITPDQSWLTFSQNNGTGNSNIALFIDTATLPIGQSYAQFLVDDGSTQKFGQVYVSVSGTSTDDYTIVNPIALEFSETYGIVPTDVRNFTIDSTLACTIAVDVPWLALSDDEAPIGLTTITASTQDTQAIGIGVYPGKITITTTEGEFFVDVLLIIVAKQFPDIKTNGFYYADDRNRIALTSSAANYEGVINIKAQGPGFGLKNYTREIPYYRNILSTVVGLETAILLQKAIMPPLATLFYKAITPVRYDYRIHARPLIGPAPATKFLNIENVHFINGKKPVTDSESESDILTYIPENLVVPMDGYIAFSVRQPSGISQCTIIRTRADAEIPPVTFNVAVPDTDIFTAIISIAQLDLIPGDKGIVTFGPLQIILGVKPTQLPTTQIIWENEWDLPEIYNCTGPVKITVNEDAETVVTSQDGMDYEKVIETKAPKDFVINTGNIYSVAEREFLATILKAKRIWVQIGTTRTEVINSTRNVDVFQTRDFVPELDLKFKSAAV